MVLMAGAHCGVNVDNDGSVHGDVGIDDADVDGRC